MKRFANVEGLTVAVVLIPTKAETYSWLLQAGHTHAGVQVHASGFSVVVRELCRAEGFPFLNLGPPMALAARQTFERSGEPLWWLGDTHWSEAGHEVASSLVYEGLLHSLRAEP